MASAADGVLKVWRDCGKGGPLGKSSLIWKLQPKKLCTRTDPYHG